MERISVHKMLCIENATNLSTNIIPQIILTQFVILRNGTKLHQTMVGLRASGRDEFLLLSRCPVDKLGTATTGTGETRIVKVWLELGDIVGRGLHRRNARRGAIVR